MKLMIVSEDQHSLRKYLALKLQPEMAPENILEVKYGQALNSLIEHQPTHVIWEWEAEKDTKGNWGGNWESFLNNAQLFGTKILFLGFWPARVLPENVRPSYLRFPVKSADLFNWIERG